MAKILIVDDEKSMREFLQIVLTKEGYHVVTASDGEEAIELIGKDIFDLVISDLKMPKASGLDVLKAVKEVSPDSIVLMITAFATTETAIEAMKQGAYNYLIKPFKIEEVKLIIKNALEKQTLRKENNKLRQELKELVFPRNIIGKSEPLLKILELVSKISETSSNILITGESGTGKELIARAIHDQSPRRNKPFVTVNCSALPENLLESELFGHMKGAFTGAILNKQGLFEIADEGTLFLDEIGDTSLTIQVKLLRVLQEREFRRVGGLKDIKVDVRIVAATNKNLLQAVAENRFREDLYYRLDVIPVFLPPLRERTGDVPLLVDYFLKKFDKTLNKNISGIEPDALQLLMEQEWKGNVRELENIMERVISLSSNPKITKEDVLSCVRSLPLKDSIKIREIPNGGFDLEEYINEIEKDLLIKALEKTHWVKTEAAKLLHLNFRSFRYRLLKYQIEKNLS
ncbi:MAG: sigma-54-dependent Fis family transcriptional regulator [Nitrospirae bacterium]|nr:sigma-54-dependent Fis family transcriptional regulator [Nitrospirota bacterium]